MSYTNNGTFDKKRWREENKSKIAAQVKNYAKKNKEKISVYKANYYQDKRDYITKYKLEHSCEICGETDPIVLDFHHINRTEKEATIANMLSHKPLKKIIEEIKKCIVVCANCHRRLHHNEKENHGSTRSI